MKFSMTEVQFRMIYCNTSDYKSLWEGMQKFAQPKQDPAGCNEEAPYIGHDCAATQALFVEAFNGWFEQRIAEERKPWVGLTAKDLSEIPPTCYEGAIWADAKLKEKNA